MLAFHSRKVSNKYGVSFFLYLFYFSPLKICFSSSFLVGGGMCKHSTRERDGMVAKGLFGKTSTTTKKSWIRFFFLFFALHVKEIKLFIYGVIYN